MGRAARQDIEGAWHHVMNRGVDRGRIFFTRGDGVAFEGLLADGSKMLGVEVHAYCLMPNHYHATWQPTLPNFSEAVRELNGNYGQWWNRKHGRVGHVFQGRFKDQIVDRDTYLLTLSRYVVMNPVRGGLVKVPDDWMWSSYRATVGLCSTPSFLAVDATLSLFGEGEESLLRARFIDAVNRQWDPAADDRIRSKQRILGTKAFKDLILGRQLVAPGAACVADAPVLEPLRQTDVDEAKIIV